MPLGNLWGLKKKNDKKVEETGTVAPTVVAPPDKLQNDRNAAASKAEVAGTRRNMNDLVRSLKSINFIKYKNELQYADETTENVWKEEEIFEYERIVNSDLLRVLTSQNATQLTLLDTDEIDKQLIQVVECFKNSIKERDKATANLCIETLQFGINEGHKEIVGINLDSSDYADIMQNRQEIVKNYGELINQCIAVRRTKVRRKELFENIKKLNDSLKKLYATMQEYEVAYEDVVKKADEMDMVITREMDNEVKEYITNMKEMTSMAATLKKDKYEFATVSERVITLEKTIETLRSSLKALAQFLSNRDLEKIRELNYDYVQKQRRMIQETKDLDDIFNELMDSVRAIYTDPDMIRRAIETKLEFKKLMVTMERHEVRDREGAKKLNEFRQQKQEQENEELENTASVLYNED